MASMLATISVAVPLIGCIGISAAGRRIRPSTAYHVTLAATGLTAVCAIALLPYAGSTLTHTLNWLPPAGPLTLGLSPTGLYAWLVTVWMLFLTLLAMMPRRAESRPLSGSVVLLTLAGAYVAFLTEHFLARYMALELVASCIALIVLVEIAGTAAFRLAWKSYLLLRLGDAALLAAILALQRYTGTMDIKTALARAEALEAAPLTWIAAGFALAAWLKLGCWPFHIWMQPGRRLSLTSHVWLYATVMPNLGAYLLYRVTPLLAATGATRMLMLCLGTASFTVATCLSVTRSDVRTALVDLGAAQGGLVLIAASSGAKLAVWLAVLVLTLLRLLLFLAADAAQNSVSRSRIGAGGFALAGLAVSIWGLLVTEWSRTATARPEVLALAEVGVVILGIWTVYAAWRLSKRSPGATRAVVGRGQWIVIGLVASIVVGGGVFLGNLVKHLAAVTDLAVLQVPSLPSLLHQKLARPSAWVGIFTACALWLLWLRSRAGPWGAQQLTQEVSDFAGGLALAARRLYATVEVGTLEQAVALTARIGVDGARLAYRLIEQEGLGGNLDLTGRVVLRGSQATSSAMEQTLTGILQRIVLTTLAACRGLQHWHTGQLRRNLLWVSLCLVVAVLTLLVYHW